MKTADFDFTLPPELIAQRPLPARDASRMMVVDRAAGSIVHGYFRDLPGRLAPGTVLVTNDTRVIPARLFGTKDGKKVEFLFIRELGPGPGTWEVLCRPAKRLKPGDSVIFEGGFEGRVASAGEEGFRVLRFEGQDVKSLLLESGFAPLPPYIKRGPKLAGLRADDLVRYQTVFAREQGSIAAPTAGLHFTEDLLAAVRARGVTIASVTLNVGLATFQPVRVESLEDHKMLKESYVISSATARVVAEAKREARPVAAVGTTSVRALESAAAAGGGHLIPGERTTDLFIRPGFRFQVVDKLLTNFHLPRSTLLMLVAALAGEDLIREAYRQAVRERYRFFSYGDCMFII